jgi:hypothetical protein
MISENKYTQGVIQGLQRTANEWTVLYNNIKKSLKLLFL